MLTRQFHDAVGVLVVLANAAPEAIQSHMLAMYLRGNASLIRRTMARLAAADLVNVQRGPGGGATLAQRPGDIDLARVLDAVGGRPHAVRAGRNRPGRVSLAYRLDEVLDPVLEEAGRAFRAALAETTVAHLVARQRRLTP